MREPQNISFGRDTEVHLGKPIFLDTEVALEVKNLLLVQEMQETQIWSLGQEDALE